MTVQPDVTERLGAVFHRVFGVPDATEATSINDIPQWDSLAHIGLLLAIETEFHVSIAPEHAIEMISVRAIREILSEYGVGVG